MPVRVPRAFREADVQIGIIGVKFTGKTTLFNVITGASQPTGQGGVDPIVMGLGPVPATDNALKYAGLKFTDIDLIEANEAFAAQTLGVIRNWNKMYGVSKEYILERANVNGGAIALGHPIGCSGNRITVTLLYEMMKRNLELGLATLCIGGGMGTAVIIKKV